MQPVSYAAPTSGERAPRLHNFSAGPGALPTAVLDAARAELPVYGDLGTSVLEISHRSPTYTEIAASARARLRALLGLGDDWHILFLQGGASMQFYQVPLNFLRADASADYLDTGTWSAKAIKEAKRCGGVKVVASSADSNYSYIPTPDTWTLDPSAAYLHYTSNNTIFGTQFADEPTADVPLVCDASSDFLSRPLDLDRYGLIYAGAQKNIGPAGVTVVLVQDAFLQTRKAALPTLLDFGTHAAKLFHTPPVYAVYLVEKVLAWLQDHGGIDGIAEVNARKATMLYGAIDATDFYTGTARLDSRSQMNVCFRLPSEDLEARFLTEAAEHGLLALKGHRSVGGIRASIYNAVEEASVEALVAFMRTFERNNG
ncbi:MAG: 3-phosphoserine/phosphohydroxythreonine transaminase [Bacteroidota bacterium]